VEKILGGNLLRVLEANEPPGRSFLDRRQHDHLASGQTGEEP
jgi:hypothetical protein